MRFAVLGTGVVGSTIGSALLARDHEVRMGSRAPDNPRAREWAASGGPRASHGTFADAAAFGEVVFNCTAGGASLQALEAAGSANLEGKILIDVANPLDFSNGMPPTLSVCNDDSLGERIQRTFPGVRVVKALNTLNCAVMVDPSRVPGEHCVFVSGDDAAAKAAVVRGLGEWFGWPAHRILDLGDITSARAAEMVLPLWIRLMLAFGSADFNFTIARPRAVAVGAEPLPPAH